MSYILTVGLEIHLKIKSANKLFCQCKNEQNFDVLEPNVNICPVCTGQPGALPTLSDEALQKALILGRALNCDIQKVSTFDRKSYFYPDLPMGYQITQLYHPTNINGRVKFFVDSDYKIEKEVEIRDAHMECDTAKMIHTNGKALIDFNRSGTPLVEIVTQPDFRDPIEVSEFLKELQRIAKYNDISDADMDKGQMRVDVNISIREDETAPYGTRVELKNINSFGMVRRAIEHEFQRQIHVITNGGKIDQETRKRDDLSGESYPMRSKEDALDYRYFPEPDLPTLVLEQSQIDGLNARELEIPYNLIKKFKEEFGFSKEYVNSIIGEKETLDYFLSCFVSVPNPKLIAKRIAGPIAAYMKENFKTVNELSFDKNNFVKFLEIANSSKVQESQLKVVMDEMLTTGKTAESIIKEKGFDQEAFSQDALNDIITAVLDQNAKIVEEYKGGKVGVIGFLIGQVMKQTQGKASPQKIQELIQQKII